MMELIDLTRSNDALVGECLASFRDSDGTIFDRVGGILIAEALRIFRVVHTKKD